MTQTALSWRHFLHALWRCGTTLAGTGPRVQNRIPRLERLEPRQAPAAHDTLATALPLTFDANQHAQVAGTLADANQVDLYALSLNAGDEVAADVSAQNAASQVDCLRMFDSSGRQLAFAEDTGAVDSSQTFEAPLAGVFYVGVSSDGDVSYYPKMSGSGSGGLTSGSYMLTLTRSSIVVTESPSNETLATAQPISGNTILQGTYVPGTTAYYAFTATGTGSLTASVTPADETAFLPRLTMYGTAGQLLIQSDAVSSGNASAQLNQHLQPGSYFLAVSAGPETDSVKGNGSYVLHATFDTALPPFETLPVGNHPASVAVGDFNHDGNLDIVTANYSDNTVSELLGLRDGAFEPAATYAVGIGPASVAVGDFNHDGNLDIVTANQGFNPATDTYGNTLSVLLGRGDGTFLPAATYSVGLAPTSVAVGDFNHDGNLDIVTANQGAVDQATGTFVPGTVSVLLGRGDGTFQPAAIYTGGGASVAVGDFNHDGNLDIVTATSP